MPPKPLINCSGCLSRHPRPSCLWRAGTQKVTARYKTEAETKMAEGFSEDELVSIFGDDGAKGLVPPRDSDEYLDYIEKALISKQDEIEKNRRAGRIADVESRLRRLSLSHSPMVDPTPRPDPTDELRGISTIRDLSKLRPESYCLPPKTHDKLTFRELIRGCLKVLTYLRLCNINVDGYLAHISFLMDKASMAGVYTTEGLVLYEHSVTSKVLDGSIDDWPEVDPASDSRFLSYEYTFDLVSRSEVKQEKGAKQHRRSGFKSKSPIYDFVAWELNSNDLCWVWNCKVCNGCERKHGICGLCHGNHKAIDCEKHLSTIGKSEGSDSPK